MATGRVERKGRGLDGRGEHHIEERDDARECHEGE